MQVNDVNSDIRLNRGRETLKYRHTFVLDGVRLGCELTNDQLHEPTEINSKSGTSDITCWRRQTKNHLRNRQSLDRILQTIGIVVDRSMALTLVAEQRKLSGEMLRLHCSKHRAARAAPLK